jgi:hypothetical protein
MPEGFRPPQGLKLTDTITRAGADSLRNQAFTLIDVAYERSPDFRRFPNCYDTNVTRVYNYFRGTVERVSTPYQNDHIDWNEGRVREGYADVPLRPTYAPVHQPAEPVGKLAGRRERLSIPAEERLGSLIAAIGTVWATYAATVDYAALWRMQILPPGPVEVCALGILVWLHAKWRRSTRAN